MGYETLPLPQWWLSCVGTESSALQLPRQLWNGLLEGLVWTVYVVLQFQMDSRGCVELTSSWLFVQLFKPVCALVWFHRLHWMRSTAVSQGVAPSLSPSTLGAQISLVLQCKYKPFPPDMSGLGWIILEHGSCGCEGLTVFMASQASQDAYTMHIIRPWVAREVVQGHNMQISLIHWLGFILLALWTFSFLFPVLEV